MARSAPAACLTDADFRGHYTAENPRPPPRRRGRKGPAACSTSFRSYLMAASEDHASPPPIDTLVKIKHVLLPWLKK